MKIRGLPPRIKDQITRDDELSRKSSVVDGPSKLCICLEDDLFMATPAWPAPMRALISKLNLLHAPERLTDSALFNRWAQRAVACIPTSSIDVATRGSSCGGSSANPPPRATAQTLRDSSSDEVMVVRANLALNLRESKPFVCNHKSLSSERLPTAPHNPVRRRSAGSCAPIDHMFTTFGLWVFVGTAPARDLISPCHDDYTVD